MKENGRTVVIIDGGGRGAALAHKYSLSPHVDRIIAIPGNDMMQEVSEVPVETVPQLKPSQTVEIASFLTQRAKKIAFVDIAQEDAVRWDLRGKLDRHGIKAVGPDDEAGRIEYDKKAARDIGNHAGLPQPYYDSVRFRDSRSGKKIPDYYEEVIEKASKGKRFVKANGLAEGKGVIPAEGRVEIEKAIKILRSRYSDASRTIVIEEALIGEEFSAFAISNGIDFKIIGYAQDHKRVFGNDLGPNTGGMGAVSNPLLLNKPELQKGVEEIFTKTFDSLKKRGNPYKGILYLGGMAVQEGSSIKSYVIEFNARWGDPEAQVLVPGLEVDLFELSQRVNAGDFKNFQVKQDDKIRIAVAGTAKGYPGDASKAQGKEIKGIQQARKIDGVTIYGAGIHIEGTKHYIDGGRLFYVVGEGKDVIEAREKAYEAMNHISVEGNNLHFRTDIGYRDVERIQKHSV